MKKPAAACVHGFVIPLAVIGILLAFIVVEVDLGTTALIGATAFVIMFVAGSNPVLLGGISIAGFGGILFVATRMPERMGRLSAFMHPEQFKRMPACSRCRR